MCMNCAHELYLRPSGKFGFNLDFNANPNMERHKETPDEFANVVHLHWPASCSQSVVGWVCPHWGSIGLSGDGVYRAFFHLLFHSTVQHEERLTCTLLWREACQKHNSVLGLHNVMNTCTVTFSPHEKGKTKQKDDAINSPSFLSE